MSIYCFLVIILICLFIYEEAGNGVRFRLILLVIVSFCGLGFDVIEMNKHH